MLLFTETGQHVQEMETCVSYSKPAIFHITPQRAVMQSGKSVTITGNLEEQELLVDVHTSQVTG